MGLADDRKPVNLMTVHVSKSVTVHEVSNNFIRQINLFPVEYSCAISSHKNIQASGRKPLNEKDQTTKEV